MNLKEAFRYQKFLDRMMSTAHASLMYREHAIKTTKNHLCSQANPEAKDKTEIVSKEEFHKNDDIILLMLRLIEEKSKLSNAIVDAKASVGFSIDAAIEVNKFRQTMASGIKQMLSFKGGKRKTQERGYKFDVSQAQVSYVYDVEIVDEEDYDRTAAKAAMCYIVDMADKTSMAVEAALVNTTVAYEAPFNVNSSFDDVMAEFLA